MPVVGDMGSSHAADEGRVSTPGAHHSGQGPSNAMQQSIAVPLHVDGSLGTSHAANPRRASTPEI